MKKLILATVLCLALPLQALAGAPPVVLKSVEELAQLPEGLNLGVIEFLEDAPVSALDPEKGVVPLMLLTPETAEVRWGKPQEIYDTGNGKGYAWANGYRLTYTDKGTLRRIFYDVPSDIVLPFGPQVLAQWGFVPTKPDFDGGFGLRWGDKEGTFKDVLLQPVIKDGQKRLGSLQIVLN